MVNLRGLATSPSTETVQGEVLEILRILRGIALVGAEFVEIVVVRDVFVGVLFFRGAERALDQASELCGGEDVLATGRPDSKRFLPARRQRRRCPWPGGICGGRNRRTLGVTSA